MKVAVLGTGLMGFPMAQNILAAGFDLSVWNRTSAKSEPLAADGAYVFTSAPDAVDGADIVISMLSDGRATADVLSDQTVLQHLKSQAIWIEMASVTPGQAKQQSKQLATAGVHHLDAPVSGGTIAATGGTLAIMVGGAQAVFDRARPVLECLGTPVHVGPSGTGQLAKLANQTIVGITIGAVAEAMLLLERGGADPVAVRQALQGGFADSTILQQHGARMTDRAFTPGGKVKTQIKDLQNARSEAATLNLTLPFLNAALDRFQDLDTGLGHGDLDHSALFLELLALNKQIT